MLFSLGANTFSHVCEKFCRLTFSVNEHFVDHREVVLWSSFRFPTNGHDGRFVSAVLCFGICCGNIAPHSQPISVVISHPSDSPAACVFQPFVPASICVCVCVLIGHLIAFLTMVGQNSNFGFCFDRDHFKTAQT